MVPGQRFGHDTSAGVSITDEKNTFSHNALQKGDKYRNYSKNNNKKEARSYKDKHYLEFRKGLILFNIATLILKASLGSRLAGGRV
jgi:hypothetical protein